MGRERLAARLGRRRSRAAARSIRRGDDWLYGTSTTTNKHKLLLVWEEKCMKKVFNFHVNHWYLAKGKRSSEILFTVYVV